MKRCKYKDMWIYILLSIILYLILLNYNLDNGLKADILAGLIIFIGYSVYNYLTY